MIIKSKIIEGGIIVTMNEKREIIKNGAILIENDKIADIGEKEKIKKEHKADKTINAENKIIIPGLVSLHFHSDNLSRGIGEHMGLEEWLEKICYPIRSIMDPEESFYSTSLAYSEAVLSGTTTLNDMYINLESCAKAAEEIGIRAILSSEAADLEEGMPTLKENEKAYKKLHGKANGRIQVWFGAEWIPVCSKEFLKKTRQLANKYNTGIHIHLNESKEEVKMSLEQHDKRPTQLANNLGILGEDVIAAHCVWLNKKEQKTLANTNTHIANCPVSNLKLGNGTAPIPELQDLGANVGLGPDDALVNNTVNMIETMKFASLAQKGRLKDASQMPSKTIMEMATINGAKALGMQNQIGSLEKGKKADLVMINTNVPNMRPTLHNNHSNIYQNIVYASPTNAINTVIINGKTIVKNKQLKTTNLQKTIQKAQQTSEKLLEKRKQHI